MMTRTANGARYGTNSSSTPNQLFTYEDVKPYTYVRLRGRPGWVLDKGSHVSSSEGEHLYIEYEDVPKNSHKREAYLHKNLVNKHLRQKDTLWVDFRSKMFADD